MEGRQQILVGAILLVLSLAGTVLAQESTAPSVTQGDVMYLGVHGAGVMVMDVSDPSSPVVIEIIDIDAEVLALQIAKGQLLVILADYAVMSFDLSDPRHPVKQEKEVQEPELAIEGSVLQVDEGWVVLNVGSTDGVEPGMRFAIKHAKAKPWHKPDAIVVISTVEKMTCAGSLPYRGSAKPGNQAVLSGGPWKSKHWLVAPAPTPYTSLKLELRPILGAGAGTGTGGVITHLEIFHQFDKPWGIGFLLSPASVGVSQAGVGAVFELGVVGGYSGRYFGFELGVGAHLSAGLHDNGLLILARGRLGPVNGVHGDIRISILPESTWYMPSTASLTVYLPVQLRLDLFFEIAGGNRSLVEHGRTGWANILGGVRAYVHGNGGPGTVILNVGMGHGYMWDEMCEDEDGLVIPCVGGSTFGPLVSIGVEWRF